MTTAPAASPIQSALVAEADATHTEFPQYANHWDHWVVVRPTVDIFHRGYRVLDAGEAVLMDPDSYRPGEPFATFYLARNGANGCDTSLRTCYFDVG